jgi:hypothetical protein
MDRGLRETEAKYRRLSLLDGQYPKNGIGCGADVAIMRATCRSLTAASRWLIAPAAKRDPVWRVMRERFAIP